MGLGPVHSVKIIFCEYRMSTRRKKVEKMPTLPENNEYNRGYNNLTHSAYTKNRNARKAEIVFQDMGKLFLAFEHKDIPEIIRITQNPELLVIIQNDPNVTKVIQNKILDLIAASPRIAPMIAKHFEYLTPDYRFNAFYGKLVPQTFSLAAKS